MSKLPAATIMLIKSLDAGIDRIGDNDDRSKSQINSKTNELIKLAKEAGFDVFQIPESILTTLINPIANLQIMKETLGVENMSLRSYLRKVETDMHSLQRQLGMEFHFFPKLPLEIQSLIWKLAAAIPRVVVVTFDYESFEGWLPNQQSFVASALGRVCAESRKAFLTSQAPIILNGRYRDTIAELDAVSANWLVDTLWINAKIDWNRHITGLMDLFFDDTDWGISRVHQYVSKFAVLYCYWSNLTMNEWGPAEDFDYTMDCIRQLKTTEIFLVINCNALTQPAEVTLCRPRFFPQRNFKTLNHLGGSETWKAAEASKKVLDWDSLEEESMWAMKEYQRQRCLKIKKCLDGKLRAPTIRLLKDKDRHSILLYFEFLCIKVNKFLKGTGSADGALLEILNGVSSWEIPKIRFVEAILSPVS